MKKSNIFEFLDEEEAPTVIEPIPKISKKEKPEKESIVFSKASEPEEMAEEIRPIHHGKENPENENDTERDIERNQARTTSRILETTIGAPGDISNFINSIFGLPQSPIGYLSSENIKKGLEKVGQGYLTPRNDLEKATDEAAQRFATMAQPGSWGYGFARNIGIPVAATIAKEGGKKLLGDTFGTYAEIGTMVAADLLGGRIASGGAKKVATKLYDQRDKLIRKGEKMNADNLRQSAIILRNKLLKGGESASVNPAIEKIDQILKKIQDGTISVDELPAFQTKINELIRQGGGFDVHVPSDIRKLTVKNLGDVKNLVIDALSEYGRVQNPEFLKLHQQANKAHAAYSKSNVISNFLRKRFNAKMSPVTKTLFGLGGAAIAGGSSLAKPALAAIGGAGTTGLAALYEAGKIAYRVGKSPQLRKHYIDVIKYALAGNTLQTDKSLKALEKELKNQKIETEEQLLQGT